MRARDVAELAEGVNLLERYSIIDHIGGGGMATIYRAHDSRLDRVVCVKLLRNVIEGSGSGGVVYQATYTHFLQEARSLSKLAHPNTLRIYDFGFLTLEGEDEGNVAPRPFQISEFLDGGNLETYVRARGALKPVEVLAILDRIASATAEAHGAGILHRDIKPSNILFSRVGDVLMPKLADFGIARAIRRQPRQGETEDSIEVVPVVPLFSPRWAAPEQLRSVEEGPATDVYALGLVVAFMLQGRALFEVPDVTSTFTDRAKGDVFVRERLALHPLAPEVARVLADALRADPATRTRTPFDFYEALSRAFGTPRASLPSPVAHSGGVPSLRPPRASSESITVEATFDDVRGAGQAIAPPERWLDVAGRRVRIVETHEKLDLAIPTMRGVDVRFRITLLPTRGPLRVNLKGLNCFVARPGGAYSSALTAEVDGSADFLSTQKEHLGTLSWSFGLIRGPGRVFPVSQGELVVPFPQGHQALALELGADRELIVICRRA
ncbi:MAG TPA: serine/threonine-protein kinase [Polyangiaceae bacterium]|jgi:serine/threonine-protein kinase